MNFFAPFFEIPIFDFPFAAAYIARFCFADLNGITSPSSTGRAAWERTVALDFSSVVASAA